MVKVNTNIMTLNDIEQPFFIYITGCDGTGKSTQAELLLKQFAAQGIEPTHLWLRFPFLFSLPLLAFARWRGYSWYEETGDVRHGYWDFSESLLLRFLFPWVLLLDAAIATIHKIILPRWRGESIICERFVLDMLVDMSLAFRNEMHHTVVGKLFLRLLPKHARIVILDLDEATVRQRRADMQLDKRLATRLESYWRLAADLSLPVFSSRVSALELNRSIQVAICMDGRNNE